MTPLEILLSYINIFFALVVFNFVFLRPETRRIIRVVKLEFPLIEKISELFKEPAFTDTIADTFDTLNTVNKTVKQIRELAQVMAPVFLAPEIFDSFLIKEKKKKTELVKNA